VTNHLLPDIKGRRILIAPLCWGLGHASRCIPIIQHLAQHNEIEIASDGIALRWLQAELPERIHHELPAYNIRYDKLPSLSTYLSYARQVSKAIKAEYKSIQEIVIDRSINLIISDHRLGARSRNVESVFMAHQLVIPFRSITLQQLATKIQVGHINKFDSCWVPDFQDQANQLSGSLSHAKLKIPKIYIGPQSRFNKDESVKNQVDILVVLSGVEPDRAILEKKLYSIMSSHDDFRIIMVRGTQLHRPEFMKNVAPGIQVFDLVDTRTLQSFLTSSSMMISRSGYSTIMDIAVIEKPAILIPSQHQPEQLYLAKLADKKHGYTSILESDLSFQSLFTEVKKLLKSSK